MSSKLFVGNLSFETSDNHLEHLFAEAGSVREAVIIQDRDTGRSRGFAFVTMGSSEEARRAALKFDGFSLQGRKLRVNEAEQRGSSSARPARRW